MPTQTGGSSTSTASEQRWEARPAIALALRAFVFSAPLVVSIVATQLVARTIERPSGYGSIWWWEMTLFTAIGVHWLTTKAARRLTPAAMLFKLSLVFPDVAPSRFNVALRSGTTRQLQHRLEGGELTELEPSEAAEYLLGVMSEINTHDRLTRGHSERVRAYSALIANELQLSEEEANKLQWAALLHDVGKLSVPEEILNSPHKPSNEEWKILRAHPAEGRDLIAPLQVWLGEWALAASEHHERWDGGGYPDGLKGAEISLSGRIVAVADAFDVMTATRSYKKALSPAIAKEELARCSGTQFDPKMVRAFLRAGLDEKSARWAPLAWLGNLPGLAQIPAAASGAGTFVATTTVVATAAALQGPLAASPPPPPVDEIVYELAVEDERISELNVVVTSVPDSAQVQSPPPSTPKNPSAPAAAGVAIGEPLDADVTTTTEEAQTSTSSSDASTTETTEAVTGGESKATTTTVTTTSTTTRATTTTSRPTSTSTTRPADSITATTKPPTTTSAPATTVPVTTTTAPTTTSNPATPPTAVGDSATAEEEKKKNIKVLKNDAPGSSGFNNASLAILSGPAHGTAIVHNDHLHYTAGDDYEGPDSLSYRICNNDGLCDSATVSITVVDD